MSRRGAKWQDVPPGGMAAGVADMELPPPAVALAAARTALDEQAVGYASSAELAVTVEAADAWWRARHGLALPADRTVVTSSAVTAISSVLARTCAPGDVAVRLLPGYPPLGWAATAARLGDRTVAMAPDDDGRWTVDLDALDAALDGARVLQWVGPANPTGTVWRRDELAAVVALAARHDVLVLSDEVWADHVHAPAVHVPLAAVAAELAPQLRVVTVLGATKSFNLAALGATFVTSSHAALAALVAGPGQVPLLAAPDEPSRRAATAALTGGGPWLAATLATVRRNRDVATAALRDAGCDVAPQEGTYLLWVRGPAAWGEEPATHLRERAGVVVTDGAAYGQPDHVRLNIALPPAACDELVARVCAA